MLRNSLPTALVMLGWSTVAWVRLSVSVWKSRNQLHKGRYHVYGEWLALHQVLAEKLCYTIIYTCLEPLLNCHCCSCSRVVVTRTCTWENTS